MLDWFRNLFARIAGPSSTSADDRLRMYRAIESKIKARYDAAQTNDDNKNHWAMADGLSAKAANSLAVRRTIRNRARYEINNNSWARGMVNRWANFLIGTGPRLQILTADKEFNRAFEWAWSDWSDAICMPEKLRTLAKAKIGDGEAFGLHVKNPSIRHSVILDIQEIECDQVTTPAAQYSAKQWVDGVVLDDFGSPEAYHLMNNHPGDYFLSADLLRYRTIPAGFMLHWFRKDRPGQVRGVSELAPGLELFGMLRRYSLATLSAAEIAAMLAAVLETEAPPGTDVPTIPFDVAEFERGMMMNLPKGHKLAQLKAEHPSTTYDAFERALLRQLASCLDIPFGIAVGDHSSYNYSSGRLDNQSFLQTLRVERGQCERRVLIPTLNEFASEAQKVPKLLPPLPDGVSVTRIPHKWHWDGMPHVDPKKEYEARKIAIESNMMSLASHYAERGEDWQDQLEQIAKERQLQRDLDIEPAKQAPTAPDADAIAEEVRQAA